MFSLSGAPKNREIYEIIVRYNRERYNREIFSLSGAPKNREIYNRVQMHVISNCSFWTRDMCCFKMK